MAQTNFNGKIQILSSVLQTGSEYLITGLFYEDTSNYSHNEIAVNYTFIDPKGDWYNINSIVDVSNSQVQFIVENNEGIVPETSGTAIVFDPVGCDGMVVIPAGTPENLMYILRQWNDNIVQDKICDLPETDIYVTGHTIINNTTLSLRRNDNAAVLINLLPIIQAAQTLTTLSVGNGYGKIDYSDENGISIQIDLIDLLIKGAYDNYEDAHTNGVNDGEIYELSDNNDYGIAGMLLRKRPSTAV